MPAGEAFTTAEKLDIRRAIDSASATCGLRFSVFVGTLEQGRASALLLHEALGDDRDSAVLVAVDPGARRLEIVTGDTAAGQLDDQACALGALTMTSAFSGGDLVGGLRNGLLQLAEKARAPRSLHGNQP